MQKIITTPQKDPLGEMLKDYLAGNTGAEVQVKSSCIDMPPMTGAVMFRSFDKMNRIEQGALGLCRGHILDLGAGSGCHALYLQEQGMGVTALDISPGCMEVMKKRGVRNRVHGSILDLRNPGYDTLLMLMNGIGICGTLEGLHLFLDHVKPLLARGGRIIADSTDLSVFMDENRRPVSGPGREDASYFGEVDFSMTYKEIKGDSFDWLYVDYYTLEYVSACHGLLCERIMVDEEGRYLVRIRAERSRGY
ncbi:class I SAM-dependent methyltransferase [Desulfospira joergensenii]|uniref:class I SAM-dependent methyltransferase n=1 Tax=Desulfospira joergensenii TaxID=53329 RepID=UPI0003B72537|nr:class I SAM-dependent methyltransferase [Desulfospira joergensenii]